MTGRSDTERFLDAFLAPEADELSDRVLQAALSDIARTPQRRALRVPWRFTNMPVIYRAAVAGLALVVLAGAGGLIYVNAVAPLVGRPSPTATPTQSPTPSVSSMWPQTSLEEVRQAQELADAGDPRYTWQRYVKEDQLAQNHPMDARIFTRFLEEVLGWEAFQDGHHVPRPDRASLGEGDVVYIRCTPGGTNPLYPTDPAGSKCAPTIDELRYEAVKINVAQLARQGATGIWVVTGWEMVGPAEQTDPRPVEAEATAMLRSFLQARIDGEGADAFADFPADGALDEIPLLYATSAGAPYERSEFELVEGPVWPESRRMRYVVRLFAENGETTVEQHFSLERDDSDRLRLVYDSGGGGYGGQDGPGTTENGKALPVTYGFLDGLVTYRAAYPLGPSHDGSNEVDRLAIVGLLPDDGAPRQILVFLTDPRPIGLGCTLAPPAADAAALARSIGSDPSFEATAPVAVTLGGLTALQMDVVRVGDSCVPLLVPSPFDGGSRDRARLHLVDLPAGSTRVLAIVTATDEDSFETVLGFAAPILDSIEFHVP